MSKKKKDQDQALAVTTSGAEACQITEITAQANKLTFIRVIEILKRTMIANAISTQLFNQFPSFKIWFNSIYNFSDYV